MGTALLFVALRWSLLSEEAAPPGDSVWQLIMQAQFKAPPSPVTLRLQPPLDTTHARIIAQRFVHPGFKLRQSRHKAEIVARTTQSGEVTLSGEFTIQVSPVGFWHAPSLITPLSADNRERYLRTSGQDAMESPPVARILDYLGQGQPDRRQLQDRIFDYVRDKILRDPKQLMDNPVSVLETGRGNAVGRARAMVELCRLKKIPARLVTGFILEEALHARPHVWVEVYDEQHWLPYDPENGYAGELPPDFMPVVRGEGELVAIDTPLDIQTSYEIAPQIVASGMLGHHERRWYDMLDFTRLPLAARTTLASLLILPLGVLFTTFCRQIIGIRSYGTFTPSLLALAAFYADWITALVLACLVASIGLTGRSLIPGKPSRLPRMTMLATLVAISMALSVSVLDHFQLHPAGTVVLLPIIVLTGLVDRVYTVADEAGVEIALIRLAWTTLIGICCYVIFQQAALGHLLLAYPELHFITLALALLLGGYTGKKLNAHATFHWLAEPKTAGAKPQADKPSADA
jgi:transglutaminase-like putative cysteine protease